MKKDQKYYGEVWFPQDETRCFCVLSVNDNDILLETNLLTNKSVHKEPRINGVFTGLGHLTFVDCKIRKSESGIAQMKIYAPKYSFISAYHPVNVLDLKFQEFNITNDVIVSWVNHGTWYDATDEKLIKKDDISQEIRIEEIGLTVTINHSLNIHSKRTELLIQNMGWVKFKLDNPVDTLEAIDIYNKFQKVLQLVSSKTGQFSQFSFKCLKCGEWAEIFYNDYKYVRSNSSFIHVKYDDITADLPSIFNAAYVNDSFLFCLDKLMENLLHKHSSHNKRFTNSISTFEAFGKLYSGLTTKKLKVHLNHFSHYFINLGKLKEENFDDFAAKIVRSRDYHIHSNLRNKDVYTEFELLYISFLIDFVVGYGLLESIGVSEDVMEKIKMKCQMVYIGMKESNQILSTNPLDSSTVF
ncbi:HEPN domain-containing protein [Maribacter polysiphoniae]|uniref:ApeA N-terminal domain 1-containing protein n=1 Tax=Maribacter polysiphoniae TaxID=429344 RepID=UPI002355629B|nr:HEPN domain-containing protein [Maribacter polysiphoniae]